MTATIQLDVLGADTPGNTNFSIFTDSDSFTNVVTTRTGTQLLAGTSISVPDGSTTVRLTTSSGCTILKDIPIDNGDTSPLITLQSKSDMSAKFDSIVGDGMNEIIAYDSFTGMFALSVNNGLSFSNSYKPSSVSGQRIMHNKKNVFIAGVDTSTNVLKVYRITDYLSGFDTANYDLIHSQQVNSGAFVTYADYLNGKYYIGLNTGLHRSSGIVDGFALVVPNKTVRNMDSYGNFIFATNSGAVSDNYDYYSLDNGLNWYKTVNSLGAGEYGGGASTSFFLESYNKVLKTQFYSGAQAAFSQRDASFPSADSAVYFDKLIWIEDLYPNSTEQMFILKHNSAYIMRTSRDLIIIPGDPYAYSNQTYLDVTYTSTGFGSQSDGSPLYLMQRNSLTFMTRDGLSSYIISNT